MILNEVQVASGDCLVSRNRKAAEAVVTKYIRERDKLRASFESEKS